jgi:molybdate/tungstate transport system substrate-binding protein
MVIAYAPNGRFAAQFAAAGKRGAMPWWEVLEQPGLRFGRTDPVGDPQGRNIIFTLQLAARLYHRPELVERVLGDPRNPAQIFSEPSIEARLQSGELDAAAAYRVQPGPFGLPYATLSPEVDLSDDRRRAEYATASLTLDGKTYRPEPLVYYAAVLDDAPHPAQAAAFTRFLMGEGQELFHRAGYDAPGASAPLRAG